MNVSASNAATSLSFALPSTADTTAPKLLISSETETTQSTAPFITALKPSDQTTSSSSQPATLNTFSSSIAAKVHKPGSDLFTSSKTVQFQDTSKAAATASKSPANAASLFKTSSSSPQVVASVAQTFGSLATFGNKVAGDPTTSEPKMVTHSASPVVPSEKSLFGNLTSSSVVPSTTPKITFGAKEATPLFGNVQFSPSKSVAPVTSSVDSPTTVAPLFSFAAPVASTESKIPTNFAFGSLGCSSKTETTSTAVSTPLTTSSALTAPISNILSTFGSADKKSSSVSFGSDANATVTSSSLLSTFACSVVESGSGPPVFGFGKVANTPTLSNTGSLFGSKPEQPSSSSQFSLSVKTSLPTFSFNSTSTTSSSSLFGGTSTNVSSANFTFGASAGGTALDNQQLVKSISKFGSFENAATATSSAPVFGASNLFRNTAQTSAPPASESSISSVAGGNGFFKFGNQVSTTTSNTSNFAFGAGAGTNTAVPNFAFGVTPAIQNPTTTASSTFAFGTASAIQNPGTTGVPGFTFGATPNQNPATTSTASYAFGTSSISQNATTATPLFGNSLGTFTSQAATTLSTPFGASTGTVPSIFGAPSTTGLSTGTSSIFGGNTGATSSTSEPFGSQSTSLAVFGNAANKPAAFGSSTNSTGSLFSSGPQAQTSSAAAPSIFGSANNSTFSNNASNPQSIFGQGLFI